MKFTRLLLHSFTSLSLICAAGAAFAPRAACQDAAEEGELTEALKGRPCHIAGRGDESEPVVPAVRPFEIVKIPSGDITIYGALWKPKGNGPFPAVIYNHGSEQKVALVAGKTKGYGSIGPFYNSKGFVCLISLRRGHSFGYNLQPVCTSEGEYFGTAVDKAAQGDAFKRERVWLQQQEVDNQDVVAAVNWLKKQPYVDPEMMIMSGISFGGIQTVLASEKNIGVKAYIPFAPGAMSWSLVPDLHERLKVAMSKAQAPIFLIQAENDYNLGPSEYLGSVLDRKKAPNQHKVYPPFMSELEHKSGHGGFATWPGGIDIWSPDVFAFLKEVFGPKLQSAK